jgi:hypothetical protein
VLLIWHRDSIISKTRKLWWIHIVGFVALYITLVWVVFCGELILNNRLPEFDLNNDGIFTSDEQTSEQKETVKRIAHDTGRKFIIYTGMVYSAIITIVLFLFDLFIIHVWSKYIKKRTR